MATKKQLPVPHTSTTGCPGAAPQVRPLLHAYTTRIIQRGYTRTGGKHAAHPANNESAAGRAAEARR